MKKEVKKEKVKYSGEAYGIIGFTLGIISLLSLSANGVLMAIIGFFFSRAQQKNNPNQIGKAGVIINIIGFILGIIFIIIAIKFIAPALQAQLGSFPA